MNAYSTTLLPVAYFSLDMTMSPKPSSNTLEFKV